MPYSLVAWVTNQMHLAQTLVVLLRSLWWHAVRARPLVWWLPLLVFGAAAFMVKEDGLMLLPAILTVHAITRRVAEPSLRPVPWVFAGAVGRCWSSALARLALDARSESSAATAGRRTTPRGSTSRVG